MIFEVIDFYEKFNCIGAACLDTCCKNWGIAVDEKTYGQYHREKGMLGLQLRILTYDNQDKVHMIRKIGGRCPFHTRKKLCFFQQKDRMELMPKVCQVYPRRTVAYEEQVEVTLELSCIRVAELFLENPGRLRFEKMDIELPINWTIDYVDAKFYQWMKAEREKLLEHLWEMGEAEGGFAQSINDMMEYIYVANQWLARDRMEEIERLHLPLRRVEQQELEVKRISRDRACFAFFPIPFLNQMIYSPLMQERAGKLNPTLDRLLKLYDNYFGGVTEAQADEFYQKGIAVMLEGDSELEQTFRAYISYLLQQTFCLACEDYYLLKPVLLSVLVLEFVMLFFLLEFMDEKELTKQKQAELIVCAERALRHSTPLNEKILTQIRNAFYR